MFMIVSQRGRNLIAIGEKLLRVWGMADIYDAAQAYESGRIKFSRKHGIIQLGEGRKLKCQISDMESVVGDLSLCVVRVPACGEEVAADIEDDIEVEPPLKKKQDVDLTEELLETIEQEAQELIPEVNQAPKRKRTAQTAQQQRVKKETQKPEPKQPVREPESKPEPKKESFIEEFADDLDNLFEDTPEPKPAPKKESTQMGASHIMSQPKDMESALNPQETQKPKKVIDDNAKGIDIDSILMDDDSDEHHLFMDDKPAPTPKKEADPLDFDDDFGIDDLFGADEEPKPAKKPEIKEPEIELDDFLAEDEPKEQKRAKPAQEEDMFNFDDLLDDEPAQKEQKTAKQERTAPADDFDLDDELFGTEEKAPEPKPKPKDEVVEVAFDDDLDFDSLFDIDDEPKQPAREPEPKKPEPKPAPVEDVDLDFDSLFEEEKPKPAQSVQTKESKSIDDDLDIDDLDLDNLFDKKKEEKPKPTPTPKEPKKPTPEKTPVDIDSDVLTLKNDTDIEKDIKQGASAGAKPKSDTLEKWKTLMSNFDIDIEGNAKKIEFSVDEYEDLLESFIRDSKDMENTLRFGSPQDKSSVVSTLSDAVSMLHLNPLDNLLHEILSSGDDESGVIDTFYSVLDNIGEKIQASKDERKFATNQPVPEEPKEELVIPEVEEPVAKEPEPEPAPATPAKEALSVEEFLKDVKMIPIEFSIKLAADELNLPDDLVLEFVHDFSNQGHENIPELIDAYQTNDLDRLQKIAHMLKGAASNLRIEPMVQNLYDLQFDTDLERAPDRIRLFAAQLMSLDKYLQQMTNN